MLGWGLEDAVLGKRDSDRFDAALLQCFRRFDRVLAKGFHSVELGGPTPVRLDAERLEAIARLEAAVPKPRRVRMTGRIDRVEPGARRFTLQLADGSTVLGVAEDALREDRLAQCVGRQVTVSGLAVFKPSGSVLRVEATNIDEPRKGSELWTMPPAPLFGFAEPVAKYRVPQSEHRGLDSIMGTWPGDEDDDALDEALEQLS